MDRCSKLVNKITTSINYEAYIKKKEGSVVFNWNFASSTFCVYIYLVSSCHVTDLAIIRIPFCYRFRHLNYLFHTVGRQENLYFEVFSEQTVEMCLESTELFPVART